MTYVMTVTIMIRGKQTNHTCWPARYVIIKDLNSNIKKHSRSSNMQAGEGSGEWTKIQDRALSFLPGLIQEDFLLLIAASVFVCVCITDLTDFTDFLFHEFTEVKTVE